MSRTERRAIDRADFSRSWIEADPIDQSEPVPLPSDFDDATLQWALKRATLIVVWGGQNPPDGGAFTSRLAKHARKGGRVVLVLVRPTETDRWMEYVTPAASADAEVHVEHGVAAAPGLWLVPQVEVSSAGELTAT